MTATTLVGKRCVRALRDAETAWVSLCAQFSPQSAVAIGLGFLSADPITARINKAESLILKRRRDLHRFLTVTQEEIEFGNLIFFLWENEVAVKRLEVPEAWIGDVVDDDDDFVSLTDRRR